MSSRKITDAMKRMEALSKEDPESIAEAHRVLQAWHDDEQLLLAAVALGLRNAHSRGAEGLPLVNQATRISRKSRVATKQTEDHAPSKVSRLVRRQRPR